MATRRKNRSSDSAAGPFELGPFKLVYREERDAWVIAWYDPGDSGRSRRVRRKATGVRGGPGQDGKPPQAAQDALADHYAEWRKPAPLAPAEAYVEGLIADWLEQITAENFAPERARFAARHWLTFFEMERSAGRITHGPLVRDINKKLCQRYIAWRQSTAGRSGKPPSGATIDRELAALRAALNSAVNNERIPFAPKIPSVAKKDKAKPRELIYTPKQIAALLEAAARLPERQHVLLFIIIMISTNGRVEAILELHSRQIKDGLINFLAPDRQQTSKGRSIVPIAPTLQPWLDGREGKIIRYETTAFDAATGDPVKVARPTRSIRTAFRACLIEAGIAEPALDRNGRPKLLAPRRRIGEIEPRVELRPIGSENTLRHTINTEHHRMGVPDAQIEVAAGHKGVGTNKRNYRHLRPEYLRDFIRGVERYWKVIDRYTNVHRRPAH